MNGFFPNALLRSSTDRMHAARTQLAPLRHKHAVSSKKKTRKQEKRTSSLSLAASEAASERASKLRSSLSAVDDADESPASEEFRNSTSTSSSRPAAYTGPDAALAVDLLPREGEADDEHVGDEAAGGAEDDEFASDERASPEDDARATVRTGLCRRALRMLLPLLQHNGADGGGRRSMAACAIPLERGASEIGFFC